MPPGGRSVARPHRFGNPYSVLDYGHAEAVRLFDVDLRAGRLQFDVAEVRRELAGRSIGCWCKVGDLCHGDVLLRIANDL